MAGIVTSASSKMKQKVGDGQCTRLVAYALTEAGKKTTRDFDVVGNTADYVWGTVVASDSSPTLDAVLPGDIIQFRNHVITVKTTGSPPAPSILPGERKHHSAVIANKGWRQDDYGRMYYEFSIIEQNYAGKKYVVKSKVLLQPKADLDFGSGNEILIQSTGKYWIYRPVNK